MLTDIEIRKAKPSEKPKKLSDSGGLYLHITAQGSKLWRMAYRFDDKQKTLSIGTYPLISLTEAREKRDEAKKKLLSNIDPSTAKQAAKTSKRSNSANCFEVIAREWHKSHMSNKSEGHAKKIIDRLEKDILPWLGATVISEIEAPDVLSVLRRIEQRGANELAHTAKRV